MDTSNKAFGILGTLALLLGWPSPPAAAKPATASVNVDVSVVDKLPKRGANTHYAGNRAPLLASPLIKLPVGSVRPEGWIRRQLELMAEGFIGRLPQLSRFCQYEGSAWTDPEGHGRCQSAERD